MNLWMLADVAPTISLPTELLAQSPLAAIVTVFFLMFRSDSKAREKRYDEREQTWSVALDKSTGAIVQNSEVLRQCTSALERAAARTVPRDSAPPARPQQ